MKIKLNPIVLLVALVFLASGPATAFAVPCGAAGAPFCDGDCPPAMACVDLGGFCDCVPAGGPCGIMAGPPLCYGDCPPSMPICADMAGVCMCTIPTLSEWGIIGMSLAMLAAVLVVRRRREVQLLG